MADGSLVGFGARWHREGPEEGIVSRETDGFVPMDLFLLRSTDGGRTWAGPEPIAPPVDNPAFEICHGVLELKDGAWLIPTATCRGPGGAMPAGARAVLFRSEDGGRTWPSHADSFAREGVHFWEQSVVPLEDDRVLAVAWAHDVTSGRNLPTPWTLSADGGRSFAPLRETGLLAQTCKVIHLGRDRLLCVYRRSDRPGLWATRARIDGGDWVNETDLPLWGAGLASSGMAGQAGTYDELSDLHFGYPSLHPRPDGDVLAAFWCLEGWTCNIRWIRIGKDGNR
jgi:hypothetical protein